MTLSSSWRPIMMLVFMALLVSSWCGYGPGQEPISPLLDRIIDLMTICMGGYIGGRSVEKITNSFFNKD